MKIYRSFASAHLPVTDMQNMLGHTTRVPRAMRKTIDSLHYKHFRTNCNAEIKKHKIRILREKNSKPLL
ncbi:hypothetical protein [Prevotella sp. OH937_COT-195]|uniref:hypothetical protein n=1 Tax=Prevotella sp. OH937_COT-195 TaxID=2491051 RepID=UPI000F64B38F|nr:hypothetical protein [Prevotella sp. OH937_COT-195]RRD02278.1 hypothetical protein EII32_03415 [Prevotella sp. OH937_COT-195]